MLNIGKKETDTFILSFYYLPNSKKQYFDIGELKFSVDYNSTQEAEFYNTLSVCEYINCCLRATQIESDKPYLLIVNPQSGTRMGQKIFDGCVSKLFKQCNIKYELLLTVKPQHAKNFIQYCECLHKYRGIITVSGDGLISEVFCGIMDRDSWKQDLESVPISVIPAGSGNGLAASICSFSGVNPEGQLLLFSTLLLTQPRELSIDLMRFQTLSGHQIPSFLAFTWGLMADVDVGSDKYRWMGPTRFTFSAAINIAKMNRYKGKFWYLPAYSHGSYDPALQEEYRQRQCQDGLDSGDKSFSSVPFRYLPDISQPIPDNSNWVLLDQTFITIIASLVPYLATNCKIAPTAQLNDGKIHIIIVHPEISRSELVSSITKFDTGGHFDSKSVGYIECVAFRLVPECDNAFMAVDGEPLANTAIQGEIMPSVAKTFTGTFANGEMILR